MRVLCVSAEAFFFVPGTQVRQYIGKGLTIPVDKVSIVAILDQLTSTRKIIIVAAVKFFGRHSCEMFKEGYFGESRTGNIEGSTTNIQIENVDVAMRFLPLFVDGTVVHLFAIHFPVHGGHSCSCVVSVVNGVFLVIQQTQYLLEQLAFVGYKTVNRERERAR